MELWSIAGSDGEFSSEEELGRMFGSVDFAWGIDFYEKDANSLWLLPNRLYRAVYYGVPPIALGSVETGRWLKERGVGLILDRFDAGALRQALEAVTPERQAALAQAVRDIPTSAVLTEPEECRRIVHAWVDPTAARGLAA